MLHPSVLLIAACLVASPTSPGVLLLHSPPLSGPRVEHDPREALITREVSGEIRLIDGLAEVAAVGRLDVPNEVKQRARELELERSRRLALRLVDELDLLRSLTDATRAGADAEARVLMAELCRRLEPNPEAAPLLEQLTALAGDDHAEELRSMVEGYWDALIERRAGPDAPPAARARAEATLLEQRFQRELRAAYESSLRRYQQAIDAVAEAVRPTPEQREAIRTIVIEHIKATRLQATPAQRRESMRAIYETLDEGRRALLFDYAMRIALPDG